MLLPGFAMENAALWSAREGARQRSAFLILIAIQTNSSILIGCRQMAAHSFSLDEERYLMIAPRDPSQWSEASACRPRLL